VSKTPLDPGRIAVILGVLWVAIRSACNGILSVAGASVIQQLLQLLPNQYRGRILALIRTAYEIPRLLLLPLAGGLIQVVGGATHREGGRSEFRGRADASPDGCCCHGRTQSAGWTV